MLSFGKLSLFFNPKIPMFWEWSALIIALFYFIVRYTKTLKS